MQRICLARICRKFSKIPTFHHGSMLTKGQESFDVARQVILIFKVSYLAKENNHFSRKRDLVLMLWNPPVTFENAWGVWCNWLLKRLPQRLLKIFYEQLIVQRIHLVLHTVLTLYFVFFFPFFLGLSWRKFPKIPRRKRFSSLNDRIFKLFHLSKAEIKRAKEMEKKLQPKSEHFHR